MIDTDYFPISTPGDYIEFGVALGGSFVQIIQFMYEHSLFESRRLFGFDSWEGLPEEIPGLTTRPDWYPGNFKYSLIDCRLKINKYLLDRKIPLEKIILVPGWFKNTLNKDLGIAQVAFANIDVDLYSSCNQVLEFLKDLLVPGSIIRFDDWTTEEEGEWRSFNEFKIRYPNMLFEVLSRINTEIVIKYVGRR